VVVAGGRVREGARHRDDRLREVVLRKIDGPKHCPGGRPPGPVRTPGVPVSRLLRCFNGRSAMPTHWLRVSRLDPRSPPSDSCAEHVASSTRTRPLDNRQEPDPDSAPRNEDPPDGVPGGSRLLFPEIFPYPKHSEPGGIKNEPKRFIRRRGISPHALAGASLPVSHLIRKGIRPIPFPWRDEPKEVWRHGEISHRSAA